LLDGLLREAAAGGATVVLASHEVGVTEALADRVVTMSGGTVLDGVPPDVAAGAGAGAGAGDSSGDGGLGGPARPRTGREEITSVA
jgi:energy-coupling factor transporter ATP-binding protein EcfA2